MITARALGAYMYLKVSGANISAESLALVFKEGRKAFLPVLKELREEGLIVTRRQVVNGKYVTQSYLTDGSPKTALLIQQTQQNSYLNLNAYSIISKKEYLGEPREGTKMDNYYLGQIDTDHDDINEQKRKERERKQKEHQELKAVQFAERSQAKDTKQLIDWSTDDSVYDFVQRMERLWHIKPWETARTRFKGAYGQARKTHGTNGELEVKMMERFFAGLEHNKHIDDPERIWKLFIRDFSSLLLDVERSTVTPEDIEAAHAIADKQWEK